MIHDAFTFSPRWLLAGVLLNRDARRVHPHLWRGGFLLLLWIAFGGASSGFSYSAAPGLRLLESLGWVSAFGLVALAVLGVGNLFRDEWVGNNWDLLQITGVSGFDLLLAKLVPTWLTALSLLLLEIPCLLLCVTLGGEIKSQVTVIEPTGSETQVIGKLAGEKIIGVFRERVSVTPGEMIAMSPDLSLVHLFDAKTGKRIS